MSRIHLQESANSPEFHLLSHSGLVGFEFCGRKLFSLCCLSTQIRICTQFQICSQPLHLVAFGQVERTHILIQTVLSVSWNYFCLSENQDFGWIWAQLPILFSPPFPFVNFVTNFGRICAQFSIFNAVFSPNFPSVSDILWWQKPSGLCSLHSFLLHSLKFPK